MGRHDLRVRLAVVAGALVVAGATGAGVVAASPPTDPPSTSGAETVATEPTETTDDAAPTSVPGTEPGPTGAVVDEGADPTVTVAAIIGASVLIVAAAAWMVARNHARVGQGDPAVERSGGRPPPVGLGD